MTPRGNEERPPRSASLDLPWTRQSANDTWIQKACSKMAPWSPDRRTGLGQGPAHQLGKVHELSWLGQVVMPTQLHDSQQKGLPSPRPHPAQNHLGTEPSDLCVIKSPSSET